MLKTGFIGENLSFNAQIKTDTLRILAEGQIHSDPRGIAVKSRGEKRSIFIRAKKTNPVKQSMHVITYMLL